MKKGRKLFNREERKEILEKTGFRCAHCGKKIDEDDMTVEHIFPFSKGGDNSEFNLTALCDKCNADKSNFVYSVEAYYKYILPEYMLEYVHNFIHLKGKLINSEQVLGFESMVYDIHSYNNYNMIRQAYRRDKRKGRELYDKIAVKLKLERAYPGQAENIVKFLKRLEERNGCYIGIYNNEYIVLDHMSKGRVLTLTNKLGEIYGVYIFLKEKYVDTDLPQLNNLCEITGMHKTYVMTLAICNDKARECQGQILADFYAKFMDRKCIPIYFNVIGYNNHASPYEVIQLPTRLEHHDGNIQFLSLNGTKEFLLESMQGYIENNIYTESEVEDIISKTLSSDVVCNVGKEEV